MEYFAIKIENKEPLKIGKDGKKSSQTERCLGHIPGSTLRGAWISKLFKNKDYSEEQKIQALTGINFYNAYPYFKFDGETVIRTITPKNLKISKHEFKKGMFLASGKKNEENAPIRNMLNLEIEKNMGPEEKKKWEKRVNSIEYNYFNLFDDKLNGFKVPKTYRFHHNTKRNKEEIKIKIEKEKQESQEKQKDKKDRDNLFRYEAIDKDQKFLSIISVNQDVDEQIKIDLEKLLKESEFMTFGGSKTSGYGACETTLIDKEELNKDYRVPIPRDFKNQQSFITILALSDCILRDEFGYPTANLDHCLREILGDDAEYLELKNKIVDTGYTQGYNRKWGARLPKETSIQAGSIWKYIWTESRNVTEEIKNKITQKLQDECKLNLYGERTNDGFGWLMVNPQMPSQVLIKRRNEDDESSAKFEEAKQKLKNRIMKIDEKKENSDARQTSDKSQSFDKVQSSNLKILLEGFSDSREEWRQDLVYQEVNSSEQNINLNTERLTSNKIQNLIEALEDYKENISKKFYMISEDKNFDSRLESNIYQFSPKMQKFFDRLSYVKNKNIFSIRGYDFKQCFEYLKNPSIDNLEIDTFVTSHLDKVQGMLYYGEFSKNIAIQKGIFLSEFLIEYLEYIKKSKEGTADGE
jgi:hypothetical protein